MTREEIENRILSILVDENNLFCNTSCSIEDMDCSHCNTVMKSLVNFFIQHEQNTLKEFVEWQAKQYKDLYYMYDEEIDNKKDYISYLWWCLGRRAGIGEIIQLLKMAIEKFLEERKNA